MGPLAGTFVQPLMGVWSDSVDCRWGQRRPFIVGGAFGVLIGLMVLAGAPELAGMFGFSRRVLAVAGVSMILLSMQPLQMGARALVAEQSPSDLVSQTNAWASRWIGLGSVFGYLLGAFDLAGSIKTLFAIAAMLLVLSTVVTCWTVQEALTMDKPRPKSPAGQLSPAIRQIFKVQAFAWMAWFPFLYYGSTYVSEGSPIGPEALTWNRGSFSMFLFATTAFCFNLVLPRVLLYLETTGSSEKRSRSRTPLATLWTIGHLSHATIMVCAWIVEGKGRIILVALAGFDWSLTQWAPFALINEYLLEDELDAGIIMGLHNVAISLPQILSALLTGCVLWGFRAMGARDELGILLSLTVVPSLLAAYSAGQIDGVRSGPWLAEIDIDSDVDTP